MRRLKLQSLCEITMKAHQTSKGTEHSASYVTVRQQREGHRYYKAV